MATTYKILGQSAPAATTNTDLYTTPSGNSAVVSTLAICNRGVSATYRVAVRPNGATLANSHYLVYDNAINQYDSVFLTLGVTMSGNDVITVYSSTANLSFSAFGSEIS